MRNNAHMEDFQARLERFQNGSPREVVGTLLNSIANFFNNEIEICPGRYQSSLAFIGVHASALTISEVLVGEAGHAGYHWFLENYMDGDDPPYQFSIISAQLHEWRNVIAHQWLGRVGHSLGYDYEMVEGWREDDGTIFMNPEVYVRQYLGAFSAGGRIWKWQDNFTVEEQEAMKTRAIRKFLRR